ncbi:hypothetical protein GALMADRAFT_125971 [Galerina marginata CBS 339.88]|uniref:NACHT domain-containing protein n=1 Tax=Galerina marginata (strain CBS 339.88) TaxID=685588 RepID=A0A067SZF5_GALM3|nr:hypothetical protein GALMADRAFT_125971 [Galerina marginata CBS 339.88]
MEENNAEHNFLITGGTFLEVHGSYYAHSASLETGIFALSLAISTGAMYDSATRYPVSRSLLGTRKMVIKTIMDWVNNPSSSTDILWLRGSAGTGKSAIMHTVAEQLHKSRNDCYGGTFFFARGVPRQDQGFALFSTLAYQLAINVPALRGPINRAISVDPTLPTKSMEVQLNALLLEPFSHCVDPPPLPLTMIIDGLDECETPRTQRQILSLISNAITENRIPLRFLIASRPEDWICDAFNQSPLCEIVQHLDLSRIQKPRTSDYIIRNPAHTSTDPKFVGDSDAEFGNHKKPLDIPPIPEPSAQSYRPPRQTGRPPTKMPLHTKYMDLTFKPIPRSSPVPDDRVAYIGGSINVNGDLTIILTKARKEIVIQAPKYIPDAGVGADEPQAILGAFATYLEIIESLVDTIEFGKTNWAYLLNRSNEHYIILQHVKILRKVACPTWAPLISLDEIEFTQWATCSDRRGIWKGKEVDIMYAWNSEVFWFLNRAMYGYQAVQGLDVTFEVYGHLIDGDGSIIGLVSEAAWGRKVGIGDRALIYQTVSKIQQKMCLYRGCYSNQFLIANGKVRLLELNSIWPFQDVNRLEEDAEYWHWKELATLFAEFQAMGPYWYSHYPHRCFGTTYTDLKNICLPPSPERPLGGFFFGCEFFDIHKHWSGERRIREGEPEVPRNHQEDRFATMRLNVGSVTGRLVKLRYVHMDPQTGCRWI